MHPNKPLTMCKVRIYTFSYMQNLKKIFFSHILSQEITRLYVPPNEAISQGRAQRMQGRGDPRLE